MSDPSPESGSDGSESPSPGLPGASSKPAAAEPAATDRASRPGVEGQSPLMKGMGSRVLGAGLTFAVTVALFALGGRWLDLRWGSEPWMVLAGTLLGIFGGMVHLLAVVAPEVLPFRRGPRG